MLWIGTAGSLEDAVLRLLAEEPDATRLAVHLDALGRIDMTGALALRALLQDAREAGLAVDVVDVRPRWRRLVARVIERRDDPLGEGPVPRERRLPTLRMRGWRDARGTLSRRPSSRPSHPPDGDEVDTGSDLRA